MKKTLLTFLFTAFLFSSAYAQTTELVVPSLDGDGNPIINALTQYIVADTNAAGEQLHDVYKLENGAFYYYNESPTFNNHVTITTVNPYDREDEAGKPAKIIITTLDDGTLPYAHGITTYSDLTLENVAFSTTSVDGNYSWANAILLGADGLTINLKHCLFELTGWGIIEAVVQDTKLHLDQCHVRNATVFPDGDEWVPFFIEVDTGTLDELIVRNCTFFNLQGSVINIDTQNPINLFVFDHNTVVNVVKGFTTALSAHVESYITNNIFYNAGSHGETVENAANNPDGLHPSIISVDTLAANVPDAPDSVVYYIDEVDRKIVVKNNAYFFSQGVQDYFTALADSVVPTLWLSERAQHIFDSDSEWPNFTIEGNVAMDPQFVNFGGTEDMVTQLYNHRQTGTFGFFGWDPDEADYPEYHWSLIQWPLPENFAYTADLPKSTDGFHLGSLVYYPDELDQYDPTTDVDIEESLPSAFNLEQNYPNPFNPTTKVNFTLDKAGLVSLKVYNMIGQEVKTLIKGEFHTAGKHSQIIDLTDIASGVYFYTLKQGNNVQSKKMVLMK